MELSLIIKIYSTPYPKNLAILRTFNKAVSWIAPPVCRARSMRLCALGPWPCLGGSIEYPSSYIRMWGLIFQQWSTTTKLHAYTSITRHFWDFRFEHQQGSFMIRRAATFTLSWVGDPKEIGSNFLAIPTLTASRHSDIGKCYMLRHLSS